MHVEFVKTTTVNNYDVVPDDVEEIKLNHVMRFLGTARIMFTLVDFDPKMLVIDVAGLASLIDRHVDYVEEHVRLLADIFAAEIVMNTAVFYFPCWAHLTFTSTRNAYEFAFELGGHILRVLTGVRGDSIDYYYTDVAFDCILFRPSIDLLWEEPPFTEIYEMVLENMQRIEGFRVDEARLLFNNNCTREFDVDLVNNAINIMQRVTQNILETAMIDPLALATSAGMSGRVLSNQLQNGMVVD